MTVSPAETQLWFSLLLCHWLSPATVKGQKALKIPPACCQKGEGVDEYSVTVMGYFLVLHVSGSKWNHCLEQSYRVLTHTVTWSSPWGAASTGRPLNWEGILRSTPAATLSASDSELVNRSGAAAFWHSSIWIQEEMVITISNWKTTWKLHVFREEGRFILVDTLYHTCIMNVFLF